MNIDPKKTSLYHSPRAFIDKRGEPVMIMFLSEKRHDKFTNMYLDYEPKASFNGLPPVQKEQCISWTKNMLDTAINVVAVSFEDGIVAHTALFPMQNGLCEFFIVVKPSHQQVGIGTQLTRCAIQVAYEMNYKGIWLCVESRSRVARHVYSKCGFVMEGDALDENDELEMTCDLSAYGQIQSTPIKSIMNTNVITISKNMSCVEAMRKCLDSRVSSFPVVDSKKRIQGILSQTDLIALTDYYII